MSQIGLTPPPLLSDLWDFFEFETYLKNADPPSRIKLRHFWIWEHIDGGRPPGRITDILKGLFRHIYIEKGQIKCINFLGARALLELAHVKNNNNKKQAAAELCQAQA